MLHYKTIDFLQNELMNDKFIDSIILILIRIYLIAGRYPKFVSITSHKHEFKF